MQVPEKIPFTVRVNAETKRKADEVADKLGISLTAAINMFVEQFARDEEMPFQPSTHAKVLTENDLKPEFVQLLRERIALADAGKSVSLDEFSQTVAAQREKYRNASN